MHRSSINRFIYGLLKKVLVVQNVKFLIIRFSSIGDIVLTSPVISRLKREVEGAEIHYLTKKQFAGIVENNPKVDKVHVLKDKLSDTYKELRDEFFNYIVDLHNNIRTTRLKNKLGLPAFSFNKLNVEKWLYVNLKINKLPDVHIVDRYMETIKLFVEEEEDNGLEYYIPQKDIVQLNTLPEEFRGKYVGLVIGAFHNTKKMPTELLIQLCNSIKHPIVILGGPADQTEAEQITTQSNALIYNACGKYNLNQSASLVKQAALIITHDTGLMHIAAAFKKKIFSIWGNTVPQLGMYPYKADEASQMFEVADLKCRPCSKIGFSRCPKKHFKCMNNQNISDIAAKATSLME